MKNKVCNYLEGALKDLKIEDIGAAVNAIYEGQIIYEKCIGNANHEYGIPVSRTTVFPISSVTKQFTAMIIMMLQEEGLLDYEEKVSKYIYDFPKYAVELNIRNLLHHVTGLLDPYSYYEDNNLNSYNIDNKIIYKLLKEQKSLNFEIGGKFDYCNSNYVLLAMIAERICNKPFRQLLKEKIFSPLGMKNSDLYDSRYVIANRAYGYKRENDRFYSVDNQWLSYGDGGIISTIEDMALWDQALYRDKLVSKRNMELAFTSGKTNDGKETNYGFGWVIKKKKGHKIIRHAGGDTGFGSMILRIPDIRFSAILLSNVDNSWSTFAGIANDLEDIFL